MTRDSDVTPSRANLTASTDDGRLLPARLHLDDHSVSSAFTYRILRSPDPSDNDDITDPDVPHPDTDPGPTDPSEPAHDPEPSSDSSDDSPAESDDLNPDSSEAYRLLHYVGFSLDDSPLIRLVLDDAGIISTRDLLDICTELPVTIYHTFRNTFPIKELSVVFDRHEAGIQFTLFLVLFRAIVIDIIGYKLTDGRFDSFLNYDDFTFHGPFSKAHRHDIARNIPHVRKYVERDIAASLARTNHRASKPAPVQSRGSSFAVNATLNRLTTSRAIRQTRDLLAATGLAPRPPQDSTDVPDDYDDDASTTSAQVKRSLLLSHNKPTPANTSRRSHLPASIRWNGSEDSFPSYEIAMNAWLLQSFMGYMVNTRFLDAYRTGGWTEAQLHAPDVSTAQFQVDNQCLCSALLASTQGRGQRHILDAQIHTDGMKAWTTFLDVYGGRNNLSLRIQRLDAKLQIPWSRTYEGGFLGYIDNLIHIHNQMDIADPQYLHHAHTSEQIKASTIRNRFANTEYGRITYEYYEQMTRDNKFDTEDYIRRLTTYYQHLEHGHSSTARAQARTSRITDDSHSVHAFNTNQQNYGNYGNNGPGHGQRYNNNRGNQRTSGRTFTDEEFAFLKEHHGPLLESFRKARIDLITILRERRTNGNTPPKHPDDLPGKLPPQYSSTPPVPAQVAANSLEIEPLYDDYDDLGSATVDYADSLSPDDMNAYHTATFPPDRHVQTVRTVQFRSVPQIHARALRVDDDFVSTPDGGADTMVLGRGWHFTEIYPHRTVNIIGFDEKHARRSGCAVGTACTVMLDAADRPILVVAHEAVENKNSPTSLLSESQMRHHGLIVDSTSTKHLGVDGLPGTQSIFSADKLFHLRMSQRSALMVCPHRLPTEEELTTLPRFELTSREFWCPHCHHDDMLPVAPLHGTLPPHLAHIAHIRRDPPTPGDHPFPIRRSDASTIATTRSDPPTTVHFTLPPTAPPHAQPPSFTPPVFHAHKVNTGVHRPVQRVLDRFRDPVGPHADFAQPDRVPADDPTNPILVPLVPHPLDEPLHALLSPPFHPSPCPSPSFFTSLDEGRITNPDTPSSDKDDETFYTARQNSKPSDTLSKAFHLTLDYDCFVRDNTVNTFLDDMTDRELLGYNEPLDSFTYFAGTCYNDVHAHRMMTKSNVLDAKRLQPFLGYRPLEVVRRTLEQTTQLATLATGIPMRRHVRALFPFLNRKRLDETVATDTFFSSKRDVSGAWCAQIFYGLTSHFMNIYPLKTESEGPTAFEDFARYEGLPAIIRSDNSKMQRYSTRLLTRLREWRVAAEFTEPHHPQQNPAELRAIRWIKRSIQTLRIRTGAPSSVWFWMAKYLVDVHNVTADETLGWYTPWSKRRGETPDISAFLQFRFYERIYYLNPDAKFPETKEHLGYWLGIADHVGNRMCYHILTADTHRVIERSVIRSAEPGNLPNATLQFPADEFEPTFPVQPAPTAPAATIPLVDVDSPSTQTEDTAPINNRTDDLVTDRPMPPRRRDPKAPRPELTHLGPVLRSSLRHSARHVAHISQSSGPDTYFLSATRLTGLDAPNAQPVPITDKPCYQLRGLSRLRLELLSYVLTLDSADDDDDDPHWSPLFIYTHRIQLHPTRQLLFRVGWQQHEPCWIDGAALRLQDPYLIVDYVHRRQLFTHSDFSWVEVLDPSALTSLIRTCAAKGEPPKYKFGELVPRSVKHALQIDATNGNHGWRDAIATELKQINEYKTFRTLRADENLYDFQRIPYHLVFDVKFDLRKKARLVAGGHLTSPPKEDLYSGVVDLMTVRIGHMIAAANDLQVCAADIGNAFLYGKTREKVYVVAGQEFGPEAGQPLIIDRGLYGLRSSSARFHEHLSLKLRSLGYRPTKADPDFWIIDCNTHYEYLATYVDDVLVYSKDPLKVIQALQCDYILKGIGAPRYYLGGDILELDGTWQTNGRDVRTALSAETYIGNVISKYEQAFSTPDLPFTFRGYDTPMLSDYHSEEDTTDLLDAKQSSVYRGLIGSANWVITLGRFDIAYAVNNLARFSMAPRRGHLDAALRIFGYLKQLPHARLLVDPQPRDHTSTSFVDYDWTEFYPDATEELPPDMPPPRGRPVQTTCYVDADHAHDTLTRRSVSGILLFLNGMPIKWYSKRQKTVETSSYGSELVAARIAIELTQELRYKLRMLGVPLSGPTAMLGDNMAVVLNTTVPSSQLKQKHNAIAYHRVREAIAAKIVHFAHIKSVDNIADTLTKPLSSDAYRRLLSPVLFQKAPFPPIPLTPLA